MPPKGDVVPRYRRLLHSDPRGILTVLLPFEPSDSARRGFDARLTGALHDAREHRSAALAEADLEAAFEHARGYVAELREPPGRSVALFAGVDGLRESIVSPLDLPTVGRFEPVAHIGPYVLADAARPRGLAVLLDDAQALLFAVEPHRPNPAQRLDDVVPQHQAQGGWSQARYQRHRNEHAHQHIQNVAAEIERRRREEDWPWLVIGGPDEARAALQRELTPAAAERIAGDFRGQFHQPVEELEALAYAVLLEAQATQDAADVRSALDAAAAGGAAAATWGPVLSALAEGAVHELLLPVDAETEVASRDAGGRLSAVAVGSPSWQSGEPTQEPAELPNAAIIDTVEQGGGVRAVTGDAAEALREAGVAAVLRHA